MRSLTPREREVTALIVSGLLNKQVGSELDIGEITVKAHRGQVMRKMRADSLSELVTIAARLGPTSCGKGLTALIENEQLLDRGVASGSAIELERSAGRTRYQEYMYAASARAEPNDGPGATFSFSIPCAQESVRNTAAAVHTA